jgi:hypothetical protein
MRNFKFLLLASLLNFVLNSCAASRNRYKKDDLCLFANNLKLNLDFSAEYAGSDYYLIEKKQSQSFKIDWIPNDTLTSSDEYGELFVYVDSNKIHDLVFIDTIHDFNQIQFSLKTLDLKPEIYDSISFSFIVFDKNLRTKPNSLVRISKYEIAEYLNQSYLFSDAFLWIYNLRFYNKKEIRLIQGPKLLFILNSEN